MLKTNSYVLKSIILKCTLKVMKIIKHGNTYVSPQIIKCECGCEFEIEDSDVDKKYLPFGDEYLCGIKCPECNRLQILKAGDTNE